MANRPTSKKIDLDQLANELELKARELDAASRAAEDEADKPAASEEDSVHELGPEFSDKLDRSLDEPLRRMRRIARS